MKVFQRLKRVDNASGFTLIEVLVALGVFTIGIMAVSMMAVNASQGYGEARESTNEVNRAAAKIDSLKNALYTNNQIFNGAGQSAYPIGADSTDITCWDFDNMVVQGIKFMAAENNQIRGPSPSNNYRLYFTKSRN